MADDSGAVRAFWFEGGPLVVFSQIANATVGDIERSVMDVVNTVMELAEGGNPPGSDDFGAVEAGPAAAAPNAAAAPVVAGAR